MFRKCCEKVPFIWQILKKWGHPPPLPPSNEGPGFGYLYTIANNINAGHNGYCQLGNGSTTHGLNPTLIQGSLNGKIVTSVACGSHHSLALTNEGEVIH